MCKCGHEEWNHQLMTGNRETIEQTTYGTIAILIPVRVSSFYTYRTNCLIPNCYCGGFVEGKP